MARRRYVSTTISQDTRVNKLAVQYGDFAALLYTWMIPHAADDATLPGDPEELLYQVLPGRRDKSPEDVQAALDGMTALGLIQPTGDGRITFPPVAFYKYQPYIKKRNPGIDHDPEPAPESAQPAPPSPPRAESGANQRNSAQNSASLRLTSSSSFSPSFSPSVMDDEPPASEPEPEPPEEIPKPPARQRRKSAVLERTPEEQTLIALLLRVDGFPPDVGDDSTEHMRDIAASFPGVDYFEVAKSMRMKGEKCKNGWLTFRNWVRVQAEGKASNAIAQGPHRGYGKQAPRGNRRRAVGAPGSLGPGGYDSWADKG